MTTVIAFGMIVAVIAIIWTVLEWLDDTPCLR